MADEREGCKQWKGADNGTDEKMSHITAAKWTSFEIPLQHSHPEEGF